MEKKSVLKQFKVYILFVIIVVAGVAMATIQSVQKANAVLYVAGTYTGESQGYGGWVRVTLVVDENAILEVETTHENETKYMGGREGVEDGTYRDQIMAAQGAEIEGVSRASFTTKAIKEAYASALEQAKDGVQ